MSTLLWILFGVIVLQMIRILIVDFGSSIPDRIAREMERRWVEEDLFIRQTLKDNDN